LDESIQQLINVRNQELLSLLAIVAPKTLDFDVVIGAVVDACQQANDSTQAQRWREIAATFCKTTSIAGAGKLKSEKSTKRKKHTPKDAHTQEKESTRDPSQKTHQNMAAFKQTAS
jgi:hypothetical protein